MSHYDAFGYEIEVGADVLCGYADLSHGRIERAVAIRLCDGEVYVHGVRGATLWWRYVKLERLMVIPKEDTPTTSVIAEVSFNNEDPVMNSMVGKLASPADASRKHVPELEQWAYNQMPKTSDHHDVRLYRYDGTDLYQWYSKVGTSIFSEPVGEPFLGTPIPELTQADLDNVRAELRKVITG